MAKKGVYKITGNRKPYTGNKTLYQVAEWYPSTPLSSRKESRVIWELFKKNKDGQFITTGIKKRGIGEFTFGKKSHFFTFKIEGYLHSPEGKEPMALIVQPQQNKEQQSKEKDITGVKITYQDGSRVTKSLSYRDRLRAIAQCRNLEGEYINFGLWEDTEKGNGHNKKNQLIMTSPPIMVDSRGYARWNFSLLPTFITLSHKKEDDKKPQEYYVTAEYNGKMQASDNLNANNQEYKIPPLNKKPQPKPETPKGSTNPNSANNKPDQKGNITRIKLVDKNGKAFSKKPKFGETIKLIIEGKDLIGKKYTLKLWEHDNTGDNDLVYNHTHIFKADKQEVLITLTDEMRKIGELGKDPKNPDSGEYWTGRWQEIFAEVIFLSISTKSQIIDVGLMEKPKLMNIGRSPAKKEESETGKTTCVCKEQYKDLVWGVKVDCEFRKKVVQICAELWGESRKMEMANGLMAVINVETGGSFKAQQLEGWKSIKEPKEMEITDFWKEGNRKSSRAVGLIQFTQDALQNNLNEYKNNPQLSIEERFDVLNKLKLQYAQMGEIKQLDKVKKYFEKQRNNIKSAEDIYLAVFAPIGIGKDNDYILYQRHENATNSKEKNSTKNYNANKSVDTKSTGKYKADNKIQRSEILERYYESKKEGEANRAILFNCSESSLQNKIEFKSGYFIYLDGSIKYIECEDNINYYVQAKENSNEFKKFTTLNKNSYGMVRIPDSGKGFNRYGNIDKGGNSGKEVVGKGDHYLLPKTAAALFGIVNELYNKGWEIHFGDMSSENGSDPWQNGNKHHAGHGHMGARKGLDLDFRYLNKNGISFQGLNTSSNFDKTKNEIVFELGHKYGFRKNYASGIVIYKKYGVNPNVGGHYDHGHLGLSDINLKTVVSLNVKIIN